MQLTIRQMSEKRNQKSEIKTKTNFSHIMYTKLHDNAHPEFTISELLVY